MKIKELPYQRYEIEKFRVAFEQIIAEVKAARTAVEVKAAHEKMFSEYTSFFTMASLAEMRFSINTNDEFYLAEKNYYTSTVPVAREMYADFARAVLALPFIDEIKHELGEPRIMYYGTVVAASDSRIVADLQEEGNITTEYDLLMSKMVFDFDGKEMPLTILRGYLEDEDRDVRRRAAESLGKGLAAHRNELDDIFDRLVKVRDGMAKKLGYDNYIPLAYFNMGRYNYDADMVAKFRDSIKKTITPVIAKQKKEMCSKLGLDKFMFYDSAISGLEEEPKPFGNKDEIFRAAQDMYDQMDGDVGDFMRVMLAREAFDVESRDAKYGGGYCTAFDGYKTPFILANFNGSSADVDVMTHEFGHALAQENVYRYGDGELGVGGMETAEVHSMSMEFFCWPYMDKFFDNAQNYRYKHLLSALDFLPYCAIVDEFQHIVYKNPELTPAERNQVYLDLGKKYQPYLSFEGIPYLEEGTRWQYQMHIYQTPFYYIDYGLAQTVAFEFLLESQKDYADALRRYLEFSRKGGTKPFTTLVKEAGLVSPFEEGALDKVAEEAPRLLAKLGGKKS